MMDNEPTSGADPKHHPEAIAVDRREGGTSDAATQRFDDAARSLPGVLEVIRHIARLRTAVPGLRTERDQALRDLAAIRGSRIWRLTAPLRHLAGRTRQLRRVAQPEPTNHTPAAAKAAFRRQCAEHLGAFLASGAGISLPQAKAPDVSILLVLFNQAELTLHCLESLADGLDVAAEVIIVDNGSTDRTLALLDRLDGARTIRAQENLHYVRGVNRAAQEARGRHVLLLNNDTRVEPGAIAAAVARLDAEPDLGAVGGPIVMLDGRLQEAGSIIWSDGSTTGYGRGEQPENFAFLFRRDVDYCSGAFLMVRREVFERLGGLDLAYVPAYYEEADLCMRIRAAGLRVGYEPVCRITHFEFGSALSADDAPRLSARNQAIFVTRHAETLAAAHHPPGTSPLIGRMRTGKAGRVLILDARDWGADAARLHADGPALSRLLFGQGFAVTFCMPFALRDATGHGVLPDTVECAILPGPAAIPALLRQRGGHYDAVLLLGADAGGLTAQALDAIRDALDDALLVRVPTDEVPC